MQFWSTAAEPAAVKINLNNNGILKEGVWYMSIWVSSLSTSCKEHLSWISIVVTKHLIFSSHNVHGSTKKISWNSWKLFYLKQESTNFMSERHLKIFKDLGKLSQIGIHDAGLHVFWGSKRVTLSRQVINISTPFCTYAKRSKTTFSKPCQFSLDPQHVGKRDPWKICGWFK